MDMIKLIQRRRSVRQFSSRPIARKTLEKIVDAARFAPTARNVQPWEFVAVTDKDMLARIGATTDHGKFMAAAAACIVVFSQDTKYYLEDCSAATENALLAAAGLGVGSCWIAADKKAYSGQFNQLLGVPERYRAVSVIALGYPVSSRVFRQAPKRPLSEVLHWEKF